MIAVIFELKPKADEVASYFEIADSLRPSLEKIDGFISIERFQSVVSKGRFLSLSFWRDEKAVNEWRNQEHHRIAQKQGRESIFNDYRLRVASVMRDYGMESREQAPQDSKQLHD